MSNSRSSRRGCSFQQFETQSENYALDKKFIRIALITTVPLTTTNCPWKTLENNCRTADCRASSRCRRGIPSENGPRGTDARHSQPVGHRSTANRQKILIRAPLSPWTKIIYKLIYYIIADLGSKFECWS